MPVNVHAQPSLKDAFKHDFLVGVAVKNSQFTGAHPAEAALITNQFNSISPENVLKWDAVHPQPNRYNFGPADRYVEFGLTNHMFIIGHVLIWHSQTPAWVFQDDQGKPLTRDALLARMREHIFTVVGRYRGKIGGWDVVNEAVNEDGAMRQSPWQKIIGDDYVIKAFQYAREADPQAELYYNDFSMENAPKRAGGLALVKKLQAAGCEDLEQVTPGHGAVALLGKLRATGNLITGVGLQGHYNLTWPTPAQVDDTIKAFSQLGVKVMITELDMNMLPPASDTNTADVSLTVAARAELDPYTKGVPAAVSQVEAERYASLFKVFVANRQSVSRVTIWGLTDGDSWLNDWPVKGRTAYPLMFDRNCQPKPWVDLVLKTAQ